MGDCRENHYGDDNDGHDPYIRDLKAEVAYWKRAFEALAKKTNSEVERLNTRLVSAETYRDAARDEAEQLRRVQNAMRRELHTAYEERKEAEDEVERLQGIIDRDNGAVEGLSWDLGVARKEVERLKDEAHFWEQQAIERQEEVERLMKERDDARVQRDTALTALELSQAENERLRDENEELGVERNAAIERAALLGAEGELLRADNAKAEEAWSISHEACQKLEAEGELLRARLERHQQAFERFVVTTAHTPGEAEVMRTIYRAALTKEEA